MPEKEGAEEKTTKSVVNKKQKQMMGEEGYDHLRDMGRVRPSKDKKDATTMPPSKEMKKTQKVNKGPSALERVKADIEKKYGKGAIMKVGKKKVKEELDLTKVAEAFGGYIVENKKDNEKQKIESGTYNYGKNKKANQNKKFNSDSKIPKSVQRVRSYIKDLEQTQPDVNKATSDFKTKQTYQQDRTYQQYDAYDDSDAGRPETANTFKNTNNTNRKKSETPKPETITTTKTKSGKITGDVEPIKPFGPKRERSKTATQNRKLQRIRVAARTAKMPVQRIVKPAGKLLTKTAKVAAKNPFATLVGASMAKDQFFPVALPKPPTVQGGKVGRRTAG